MALPDPHSLEEIGLSLYERKALMAIMLCGVADAATLCREGDVPTSKIYLAMEKLAGLGLVQLQPTRPRMFAATWFRSPRRDDGFCRTWSAAISTRSMRP